ncbi:MAG: peptidase S10 [Acidobacteria bacterium]|nr:peptidase S10 [Acidobacteriota bacterium]MBW4045381.1 peptidase S10 [Acidobacteriota bacterium]
MKSICLLALCLLAAPAFSQTAPHEPEKPAAAPAPAMTVEKPSVTHHKIVAHGKTLSYTATAGRLPIRNEKGDIEAEMFYVAYTLDGAEGKRPLTFAFNGGPGSATVWLHMGAFGPKRVKMLPNGFMPPPPYQLEDNQDTWLDKSDLVFVDAIGTGYSRPATPELGKKFWSVKGDVAAFGEFIRLYLQQNSRWTSPLYLAGESYGTTRAAGLSGYLVDHGIALNGIVLISTVMQFQTLEFDRGNDQPYALILPTYAMIADYHKKLAAGVGDDPVALRHEVEQWVTNDYTVALQKGDSLTAAERDAVAEKLARYTGLPKQYILEKNLRIDLSAFDTELMRSDNRIIGRLDGRFTGTSLDQTSQEPDYDPSESAIRPPYTSLFGDYVKQELGYETDLTYYILGGGVKGWDFNDEQREGGYPDTSESLQKAFAKNPYMRVFVAEGNYDCATPYFAVDYTLDHMGLTPEEHSHITRDHFEAGHMVYIDQSSLDRLKKDVDSFYDTTAHPTR